MAGLTIPWGILSTGAILELLSCTFSDCTISQQYLIRCSSLLSASFLDSSFLRLTGANSQVVSVSDCSQLVFENTSFSAIASSLVPILSDSTASSSPFLLSNCRFQNIQLASYQSCVSARRGPFYFENCSFADCQLGSVLTADNPRENQWVLVDRFAFRRLALDSMNGKFVDGALTERCLVFSDCIFDDAVAAPRNGQTQYLTGCRFTTSGENKIALAQGTTGLSLAGCCFTGFASAVSVDLHGGTVFQACDCNFSSCRDPLVVACTTQILINCVFAGVTGVALQIGGYNHVIQIYHTMFGFGIGGGGGGVGVYLSGNQEGVLEKFVLQECAFVGGVKGVDIWIGLHAVVEIGPDVCFSMEQEKAVVVRGLANRAVFTNVTFASEGCLAGFETASESDHCETGGNMVWPTLYPTWQRQGQPTGTRGMTERIDQPTDAAVNYLTDTSVNVDCQTVTGSPSETGKSLIPGGTAGEEIIPVSASEPLNEFDSSAIGMAVFAMSGCIGMIGVVVIIWFVLKKRRHNQDGDQGTDLLDGEQSDVYTMALEDDIETRTGDLENRRSTLVAQDSDSDDPIFINAYGISDDGRGFTPGHTEFETDDDAGDPYANRPGRSSILNRPLLGHF